MAGQVQDQGAYESGEHVLSHVFQYKLPPSAFSRLRLVACVMTRWLDDDMHGLATICKGLRLDG